MQEQTLPTSQVYGNQMYGAERNRAGMNQEFMNP